MREQSIGSDSAARPARALPLLASLAAAALTACAASPPAATSAAPATPARAPSAPIGIASFNMAWAGTMEDFKRYLQVCGAPDVNWCDTRARAARGSASPTPEEQARATRCQEAIYAAAGSREASALVVPCGAYRAQPPAEAAEARKTEAYAAKLAGLRATVERVIESEGVSVLAFQEVRSKDVVQAALGRFADRFDACAAPHNGFQTVAFAWDKAISGKPGVCTANDALALVDSSRGAEAFRRVRPGLALELTIDGAPVTFLNVHLKSGCANIVPTERFPARLLDDPNDACVVFNRQVPILEAWIDAAVAKSPRLVLLGDVNRRIDEEQSAAIAKKDVRSDGSDPAGPNRADANGVVPTRYLWPEIADGSPVLHQVPLSTSEGGCAGFTGLDHIVISDAVKAANPGVIPSRKVAVDQAPGQVIDTSDHCPRIAKLRF